MLKNMLKFVQSLPVFSDHDHHLPDTFFAEPATLERLISRSYVNWKPWGLDGARKPRQKLVENFRQSSCFTWFEKGVQAVHRITQPITPDNWDAISRKIAAAHARNPDFHWKTLQRHGYEKMILDTYWEPGSDNGHPELFVPTFRIDNFMYGHHRRADAPENYRPWEQYGFKGGSLDDYVDLMRQTIIRRHSRGQLIALKCAEAYHRPLDFFPDDRQAARRIFGRAPSRTTSAQKIIFANYIFHRCCELAATLDIPFQIHTGLAQLAGSNPMRFEPAIARHPQVRFVLFHAGYPWIAETAGLLHNYPNALPNLTWVPIISTSAAIRALHEFLDVAASAQSITWGSDCWTAEESVGAMQAWQFVVAKVLSERIHDRLLTVKAAEKLAAGLMHANGRNIYSGTAGNG